MKKNLVHHSIIFVFLAAVSVFAQARSFVELRTFTCSSQEKRDALMEMFDGALIPALQRQGVSKLGVYSASSGQNKGMEIYDKQLFTVAVYKDLESYAASENKLLGDKTYIKKVKALFNASMKNPLYDTCKSSLLQTFDKSPEVVQVAKSPDRIVQIRIYNSYTIERNAKKISMFDDGGEIQLFRDAGMPPVFFGHAVSGDKLPNLTYMLSFETPEEKKKAWRKFVDSDGWKKLKADGQYKNTANKITNIILKPSRNSTL